MSQIWTDNPYQSDHAYDLDLQAMEDNFAALKTTFAGAGTPANAVPGLQWFNSAKNSLRIRNAGNTAWLALLTGDNAFKIWMYRNDACPGWVVDSNLGDRVLATASDGVGGRYGSGGNYQGSWIITGLSGEAHTHGVPNHDHNSSTVGGTIRVVTDVASQILVVEGHSHAVSGGATTTGTQSAYGVNSGGQWRPASVIGTLQYPDLG